MVIRRSELRVGDDGGWWRLVEVGWGGGGGRRLIDKFTLSLRRNWSIGFHSLGRLQPSWQLDEYLCSGHVP